MAPPAKIAKRNLEDDFVFTISDSDEDVPDLDDDDDDDDSRLELSDTTDGTLKRKRTQKQKKAPEKRRKVELDKENDGDATSRGASADGDGVLNPDFEFEVDGQAGLVEDGWYTGQFVRIQGPRIVDIDEIVKRRKLAKEQNGGTEDHVDVEMGEMSGMLEDDDDELIAEDAFGMGAIDEDSGEEDAKSEDEDLDEQLDNNNDTDDREQQSDEDEDEDGTAAPTPHPDDLLFHEDLTDSEPEEDPEEVAQRNAFFAPQDETAESQAVPETETSFQKMALSRPILKGITAIGFTRPTPIQNKTVPVALLGKDVVGGAVTGSGKTAAFIIPILERLLYRPKKVATTRVGILMPTRELAVQCFSVATKLAMFTDITFALIVGGLSLREQEQTLKKRPDVIIATPGRFIDHMRNTASFVVENLEILVLDEADRMLEDGFADELNEIITTIPRTRQTMLFSATMTEDVDKLIRIGMTQPVRLLVDAKKQTVAGLTQEFIKIRVSKNAPTTGLSDVKDESRRLAHLLHLVTHTYTSKTIVFLPTKALTHRVKVLFALNDVHAAELHGSMSQEQRLSAMAAFRDGVATHLLATDLASRGLDIPRVETVINYTVPPQTSTYLHRVGRTARAGRTGVACTLFASVKESKSAKGKSPSERALLKPILRVAKTQKALIRTRTLPADAIAQLIEKLRRQHDEVEELLQEEKEERLIAQTERDVTKSENMIKHGEEIAARPRRTWFQTNKDKVVAKEAGREQRVGVLSDSSVTMPKKVMGKLSNKQKKALDARDERVKGSGWKKGKDERMGKGMLKSGSDGSHKKKPRLKKGGKLVERIGSRARR